MELDLEVDVKWPLLQTSIGQKAKHIVKLGSEDQGSV